MMIRIVSSTIRKAPIMIHAANLKMENLRYQELKSRLHAEFTAVDAETIADTLEGITDLHEMIAAVIRSSLVDEALHAGLRLRLDDMRERSSRLELRASKKRQLVLETMTRLGSVSSSSQTLPPRPELGLPPSWSALRIRSQTLTGCLSPRSSIAKRS